MVIIDYLDIILIILILLTGFEIRIINRSIKFKGIIGLIIDKFKR